MSAKDIYQAHALHTFVLELNEKHSNNSQPTNYNSTFNFYQVY